MDKKKILTIGAIIAIIVSIVAIIIIVNNKEPESNYTIEGINLPENKEILKETTVSDLKIKDISLLTREGISTYKATVVNETNKEVNINKLFVVFYENDIENKVIALYDTKIDAKKEKYIDITSEKDLSNVTKIEYILE